jgi:glycosyltransferase involved in cell wall biosynthesis
MDTRYPRVTLGLPVFNGERYLHDLLRCLLNQSFSDFELIISDNASTDATDRICREFAQRDGRIRYSRNEQNTGLAANHNRVFSLSRGEFFKWVAHDDEYLPQMIERCIEVFDSAPRSVCVVYTQCETIDERSNSIGIRSDLVENRDTRPHRRLAHFLRNLSVYNFTFGLIRSEVLRRTSGYGRFPMSDGILFAELAMLGELREIPEPLLRLRIHSGRSFQAHRAPQALRELFDPSLVGKKSFLSLEGRAHVELMKAAWRTPSGLISKILCFGAALLVPSWRRLKNFGGYNKRRESL